MSTLTTRDKVRRTLLALVGVAGAVGIVLTLNSSRDFDQNGDPVEAQQDLGDVVESGDPDAISAQPPPPSGDVPTQRELVEQFIPSDGSEALSQVQIGIDLAPGYDARLVVNGVPIPDDQVQRRSELNQLFFKPGEGLAVEALLPGDNVVRAEIFNAIDGRDVRTVEWNFEVT